MKIGELAAAAGCQTVTVRFYERKGLLGAPARTWSNYRVYGQAELDRLLFIRKCRTLGLTLQEIMLLVGLQDNPSLQCDDVNAVLDHHLAEVRQQIQSLRGLEVQLQRLRERCAVPGAVAACGVLSELSGKVLKENTSRSNCSYCGVGQPTKAQAHERDGQTPPPSDA